MVIWSDAPYEYGPAQCVRGAGLCQVFDQPETDVPRQGNAFYTVSLAAHYDRARSPVDIVQHELCDLAASKSQPDQQGQNGKVPTADGGIRMA